MIVVASQRKKAGQTAIFTYILSKYLSSPIYSLVIIKKFAKVLHINSYGQNGVTCANPSASLGSYLYVYSFTRMSCPLTLNHSSINKIGFSPKRDKFNHGFSLNRLIYFSPSLRNVAYARSLTILRQARNPATLAEDLESALEDQRIEDALKGSEHNKQLEGFPRKSLLNWLICLLTNSGDLEWLDKAYSLFLIVIEEKKWELLDCDYLILLCQSNYSVAGTIIDTQSITRQSIATTISGNIKATVSGNMIPTIIYVM